MELPPAQAARPLIVDLDNSLIRTDLLYEAGFAYLGENPAGIFPLDAIVADAKGRLYLAKDSCQSRALFEAGYPELEAFRKIRKQIDPKGKFASHQSRRLGL